MQISAGDRDKIEVNMQLNSIEEIVKIGVTYKHNWFRGHSKCYNNLFPRVFRQEFQYNQNRVSGYIEMYIIDHFKRVAPSLKNHLPESKNHLDWLILMQHFGTPTRLLDWTESILVAAFFACSANENEDGELWRMYPQILNKNSIGLEGFPLEYSKYLKFLAGEPLHSSPTKLAEELGLEGILENPVAFYPTLSFPRMTSQLSVFTIHSKPSNGNSIQDILGLDRKHIERYVIPKEKKKQIISDLSSLGLNFKTLFQDLDSLSKDLVNKYSDPFWNIWGQPID